MKSALGLPLFAKVCLINGAVYTAGAAVLVVSPATVSPQPTWREVVIVGCGLVVIFATNALLLRGVLTPLDRLVERMDRFDTGAPGERLPEPGDRVAAAVARSFNALLTRLEVERAEGIARALTAQEDERQRIARELHDEVGQSLTVILLSTSRALDTDPTEARGELTLIQDSARSSFDEVRRIVQGLRPGVLDDLGLTAALTAMANEVDARSSMGVRLQVPERPLTLPSTTELVIFRVAQEALTNVQRHAGAGRVDLRLVTDPEGITLSVTDDGRGFDPGVDGQGVRGMRERALAVGGALRIGPAPAGGTEVSLRIPVRARTS